MDTKLLRPVRVVQWKRITGQKFCLSFYLFFLYLNDFTGSKQNRIGPARYHREWPRKGCYGRSGFKFYNKSLRTRHLYLDQEHGHVNESTIEPRDFVSSITRINDHKFYLKVYKSIYTRWQFRQVSKWNNVFIMFSHLPSFIFFFPFDVGVKLMEKIKGSEGDPTVPV